MFLKIINIFTAIFGYKWVKDTRPAHLPDEDIIADEGWDDLDKDVPKYRLVKCNSDS